MSKFAVGDRVRVVAEDEPHTGRVGVVVSVIEGYRLPLGVEIDCGDHYEVVGYADTEVALVRAVITAPRVVTVVI